MTSIHRSRDPPGAPERRGSASYIPPPPTKKEVLQQKAAGPATAPHAAVVAASTAAAALRAGSLDRTAVAPFPPPVNFDADDPAALLAEGEDNAFGDDPVAGMSVSDDDNDGVGARRPGGADSFDGGGTGVTGVGRGGGDPGGWAHFSDVDSDTGLISGSAAGKEPLPVSPAGVGGGGGKRHKTTDSDSSGSSGDSSGDSGDDTDGGGGAGVRAAGPGGGLGLGLRDEDPLAMTREQREYYATQFLTLCPTLSGRITGQAAKQFFEKSRLPPTELSRIWALSDRDMDGQLTLAEFSIAMHLVVLRRNNVAIPERLAHPQACGEYTQLSEQEASPPPPPLPPPPPPPLQQHAMAAAASLQPQLLHHPPSEPSVFGGIPPSIGVLHPTPRKPLAHLPGAAESAAPTVPPRAGFPPAPPAAVPPNRERLLAAVKAQKETNHTLVRLNNELAMELKEVTEQRIALELELERLKPLN